MLGLLARRRRRRRLARRRTRCGSTPRRSRRTRPTTARRAGSARRSCSPARCSRALGRASVPPPGGDVIGRRRLDPHIHAFERARRRDRDRTAATSCRADGLRGTHDLPRRGVGDGDRERDHGGRRSRPAETTIVNAACEPHVQDLCHFLVSLGARIEGIGSNVLHIEGVDRLARRRAPDRPRAHRGRQLHRPRRGHRRRHHDRGRRARRPRPDPARLRAARRPRRARRRLGARAAGPGARRSATTSAARSRRSRTARGPRSRPTSRRSRSRSRRRRGARS